MIAQMLSDFIARGIKVDFQNHGDYYNATIPLKDGMFLSLGYGPAHYCTNRFDSVTGPTTALLKAKTAEIAILDSRGNIIGHVKGWQDTRKIRALVRKWS